MDSFSPLLVSFSRVHRNLKRFSRICRNLKRFSRICRNLKRFSRICRNLERFSRICRNYKQQLFKAFLNSSRNCVLARVVFSRTFVFFSYARCKIRHICGVNVFKELYYLFIHGPLTFSCSAINPIVAAYIINPVPKLHNIPSFPK